MKIALVPALFAALALGACAEMTPPTGSAHAAQLQDSLIQAKQALTEGRIDQATYERILVSYQHTVATLAAVDALAWGNFPSSQPQQAAGGRRPMTRVEAIHRIMETLNQDDTEPTPPANPRQ